MTACLDEPNPGCEKTTSNMRPAKESLSAIHAQVSLIDRLVQQRIASAFSAAVIKPSDTERKLRRYF